MAFLGQEEQLRELQDRFKYIYTIIFIGLAIMTARLVYLQLLQGDKMRQYSEENRIKRVRIPAPRGMIFDRNRSLLVDNRPSFDLEITPQYLRESGRQNEVIDKLGTLIEMSGDEIREKLRRASGQPRFMPVKIKTDLNRDEVAKIETWRIDMPGVSVEMEIERANLFGEVGSHLFGYIGRINATELASLQRAGKNYKLGDSMGKFGIEQQLEEVLRGIDGEDLVEVDALGRRFHDEKRRGRVLANQEGSPSIPGKNLVLTIDQDLQDAGNRAFKEHHGALVAINPKTGEILAMLSRPSFNPRDFSRGFTPELWNFLAHSESKPLWDRTIQDHHSPGSVFKIVTAVAGLEEGAIDEKTRFHCGGALRVGNRLFHCHKKGGHGEVNVVGAITQSCDVFFYRLAQKLGTVDKIAEWAFHLGLGKRTGIPLAREAPGLIPTEAWKKQRTGEEWLEGESLNVAIGQGAVLTTVLQLANMTAAIGNGGTLYKPYFIKTLENPDGEIIRQTEPTVVDGFRLKPKTMELIERGLWGVINHPTGTAYWQRIPGIEYSGKTGTVQLIRLTADKIYQKCSEMKFSQRHNGVFVGFAPPKNPVIAVAVLAEHGCSGSGAAAPVAREVIKTYLEKYDPELYGPKAVAARVRSAPRPAQAPIPAPDPSEEPVE